MCKDASIENKHGHFMRYHKPIALLSLNVPLLPLEKKLLNIILSDFVDEFHSHDPIDLTATYQFSINLNYYNQKIKNDRKLGATTIVEQIKEKEIAVCTADGKETPLFSEFQVNNKTLSFSINDSCNRFFCLDELFILSKSDHSLIKKKNTLTLYEICMFSLCYPSLAIDSKKTFRANLYKQNEVIGFSQSFQELKIMFGKNKYESEYKSEFDRSVLDKSIADLNSYSLGFKVEVKTKNKHEGYAFEITMTDAAKYNLLLNL